MTKQRAEVCEKIQHAFAAVILEDGIGLREAQAIDDYKEWRRKEYREEDEKNDWAAIMPKKLSQCHSSLSYFDPKGMRFHLPAFLIAELKGTVHMHTDFHLTNLSDYTKEQFALLSPEQRGAVRAFLFEIAEDQNFSLHQSDIDHALVAYWNS